MQVLNTTVAHVVAQLAFEQALSKIFLDIALDAISLACITWVTGNVRSGVFLPGGHGEQKERGTMLVCGAWIILVRPRHGVNAQEAPPTAHLSNDHFPRCFALRWTL